MVVTRPGFGAANDDDEAAAAPASEWLIGLAEIDEVV